MSDLVQRSGLTLVEGAPFFVSNPALSTTVVEFALADATDPLVIARRVVVTNGSTTNTVGFTYATSAPTAFTADYNATTGLCFHVPPGDAREFTLSGPLKLYVVASAAGTAVNVASWSLR